MIESNLKIKNDTIYCNDIEIEKCVDIWIVYDVNSIEFDTLEKAIKHCEENKE